MSKKKKDKAAKADRTGEIIPLNESPDQPHHHHHGHEDHEHHEGCGCEDPGELDLTQFEDNPDVLAMALVYTAHNAGSAGEALDLCRRALALDPSQFDARMIINQIECDGKPDEMLSRCRAMVDDYASRLPADAFSEIGGFFGRDDRTLDYFHSRIARYHALITCGELAEAQADGYEILRLDPADPADLHHPQLALLIRAGKLDAAEKLLEWFDHKESIIRDWLEILTDVLSGFEEEAADVLDITNEENEFVRPLLLGKKKPVDFEPEAGQNDPGSIEEASHCLLRIAEAWDAHPGALDWLRNTKPRS